VLFFLGIALAVLAYLFYLGASLSVDLDGWKRALAFCTTIAGLIFLWSVGFFELVVETCMPIWTKT
jgi:hypothetical protein